MPFVPCVFWRGLAEPAGAEFLDAERPEEALWNHLKEDNALSTKNTKLVLGRFLGVVRKLRDELKHFGQRRFLYLHTCLEMDFVGSKKFASLVSSGAHGAKSTNSRVETPDEATLRKSCANNMVI